MDDVSHGEHIRGTVKFVNIMIWWNKGSKTTGETIQSTFSILTKILFFPNRNTFVCCYPAYTVRKIAELENIHSSFIILIDSVKHLNIWEMLNL